jgi:hypothetical protein
MLHKEEAMLHTSVAISMETLPQDKENGIEFIVLFKFKTHIIILPMIAAAPLNRINKPKALVSLSRPSKSTKMMEVSEIYPAERII